MRKQSVFHAAEKHQWKFETFGGVHRHQLYAVLPGVRLTLAGFKCGMREKCIKIRHFVGWIGLKAFCRAHELFKVFDTSFASLALFLFEKLDESAGMDRVIHHLVQV